MCLAGISVVITNLAMARLKEQQRGQQVVVKLVVVTPKELDLLDKNA